MKYDPPEVKLCKDCAWARPDQTSPWTLKCVNPEVNAKDQWALSQSEYSGSSCLDERAKKSWFAACGMKGRKWWPK